MLTATILGCAALCGAAEDEARWVNPLCEALAATSNGPFTELADGSLMTIEPTGMRTSTDEGVTWSAATPVCAGIAAVYAGRTEPAAYYVLRTKSGVLVALYLDLATCKFVWDDKANQPVDCVLEVWAVRSLDGGKTWVDRQRVLEGYNPNFFGFIQITSGRLVGVIPHMVLDPGRYVGVSLTSDDDGKTWAHSNFVDLGGHGNHSGAMEPSVVQLSDDRLMMLIRTHWNRFWEAYSDDGGLSWRTVLPSKIESCSAPGYLLKLRSGRLALLCNGKANREELLLSFSEDDGKTWTRQIVLARQKGGQLSYPFFMERRPGELWAIAGFAFKKGWNEPIPLRLKVNEEALVAEAKKAAL
jgi:hypothetical protein